MRSSQPSVTTVLVASASSAAAAVVVHALWAPGTIAGAPLTPVLVALFDALLRRPSERLARGVRERLRARQPVRSASAPPSYRIYRARPSVWRVLATGMTAFAIGATALTATELALQRSVGDHDDRTTLLGGSRTQPRLPSPSPGPPSASGGQPPTTAPMRAAKSNQREAARQRRSERAPERRHEPDGNQPAKPTSPTTPAEAPASTVPTPSPPPPSNDSSGAPPPSQ